MKLMKQKNCIIEAKDLLSEETKKIQDLDLV